MVDDVSSSLFLTSPSLQTFAEASSERLGFCFLFNDPALRTD